MNKFLALAVFTLSLGCAGAAFAQVPPGCSSLGPGYIRDGVSSCAYLLKVNPDGSINVNGTTGGGSPANFTPAQVSVATTATLIVAARTGRNLISIVNTTTTPIYLGGSGVTTSTGQLLPGVVGASLTLPYTGALYGIVASGTATVTEAETY